MANEFDKGEFKEGDRVAYVPLHADGDLTHPDCETGTVTKIGGKYTFVTVTKIGGKYTFVTVTKIGGKYTFVRFDGKTYGIACDPDDLVSLEKK